MGKEFSTGNPESNLSTRCKGLQMLLGCRLRRFGFLARPGAVPDV
jgi:hypothetical protein